MPIEPNYRRIGDLDKTLPADNDPVAEGDDHLRGVKSSLLGNFTSTATELWGRLVETGPAVIKFLQNAVRVQTDNDTADQSLAFRNAADDADQAALRFSPSTLAFIMETLRDGDALAFRTRVGGVPGTPLLGDAFNGGRLGYQNQGYKVGVAPEGGEVAGDGSTTQLDFFFNELGVSRRARINVDHVADVLQIIAESGYEIEILKGAVKIFETSASADEVLFRNLDGTLAFKLDSSPTSGGRGNSYARVYDFNGNQFPVGFNVLPFSTFSAPLQMGDEHCGFRLEALASTTATLPPVVGTVGNYIVELSTDTGAQLDLSANPGQQIYLYRGSTFGREGPYTTVRWAQGITARVARRTSSDDWDILDLGPVPVS